MLDDPSGHNLHKIPAPLECWFSCSLEHHLNKSRSMVMDRPCLCARLYVSWRDLELTLKTWLEMKLPKMRLKCLLMVEDWMVLQGAYEVKDLEEKVVVQTVEGKDSA